MRYLFFPILVSIYGLNCTSKQPRVARSFPLFSPNFLLCGHVPFKRQTVMVIVVVGNNANRDHGSVHSGGWFARRETYLVLLFMASSSHFLTFHHFKRLQTTVPFNGLFFSWFSFLFFCERKAVIVRELTLVRLPSLTTIE